MGECNVCLSGFDGDLPAFSASNIRTARKQHKCCECEEPILIGQKYESYRICDDGEFQEFKTCLLCVDLRTAFNCEGNWTFETMWDDIEEFLFPEMTTGCLQKIQTAAAKEFLVKRWNEWKFGKGRRG
jgi:hypothetical protein